MGGEVGIHGVQKGKCGRKAGNKQSIWKAKRLNGRIILERIIKEI
jgi:hypothetical protein